jgi:DNA-binding CsgD family transcriptional regulator
VTGQCSRCWGRTWTGSTWMPSTAAIRSRLTPRQKDLLRLLVAGQTNTQIAHRLGISEGTAHTHLENIYERLHVSSRTVASPSPCPAGSPRNWRPVQAILATSAPESLPRSRSSPSSRLRAGQLGDREKNRAGPISPISTLYVQLEQVYYGLNRDWIAGKHCLSHAN